MMEALIEEDSDRGDKDYVPDGNLEEEEEEEDDDIQEEEQEVVTGKRRTFTKEEINERRNFHKGFVISRKKKEKD